MRYNKYVDTFIAHRGMAFRQSITTSWIFFVLKAGPQGPYRCHVHLSDTISI